MRFRGAELRIVQSSLHPPWTLGRSQAARLASEREYVETESRAVAGQATSLEEQAARLREQEARMRAEREELEAAGQEVRRSAGLGPPWVRGGASQTLLKNSG